MPAPATERDSTPAFLKQRTASRMAAMQVRENEFAATQATEGRASPSWASMSGDLPERGPPTSMRLTSVHIGSSKLDASVSFPEYNPSPPPRARTPSATLARSHGPSRFDATRRSALGPAAADPVLAFDTGALQGTRPQAWRVVGRAASPLALAQPNWASSSAAGARAATGSGYAQGGLAFSPIKKNHVNSTKRELDLFGTRPVSPARDRPGGGTRNRTPYAHAYKPPPEPLKLAEYNSFGTAHGARVYASWADDASRGARRATGQPDRGPVKSFGPRGRVPAVSLNSGRIDTMLERY